MLASFHVYITSINRMIRWKRKKAKYPDEKFAKDWKPLGKKQLTLACIISGFSASISQFFSSCQLLAQNWILKHRARMQKYPSGNLGDALLSTTDLIYNSNVYLDPGCHCIAFTSLWGNISVTAFWCQNHHWRSKEWTCEVYFLK